MPILTQSIRQTALSLSLYRFDMDAGVSATPEHTDPLAFARISAQLVQSLTPSVTGAARVHPRGLDGTQNAPRDAMISAFVRKNAGYIMIAVLAFNWPVAQAADLKQETVQAWEDYLQSAIVRIQQRLQPDAVFLWMDEAPDRIEKVRKGQIVVAPAQPHIPRKVPSGLIHDWMGVSYVPGIGIRDVLPVMRDYGRYKEFYQPHIIESKMLGADDTCDRFSMVLMNKAFFKKTALDSDYQASYFRVDDHRLYSISKSTRIQEISEYGMPGQHTLPENEGTGLIWRLYSVVRFEERDAGLYIEVEAIALSRDIPAALRVVAEPIVRRVSRDSLITALKQTEAAVRASAEQAGQKSTRQ
jgi:hypothetical protein